MFSADRMIISFRDCDRKFPPRKKTNSKHKYSPVILRARDKTEVEALSWADADVRVLTRSLNVQAAGAALRGPRPYSRRLRLGTAAATLFPREEP